ESRLVSFGSSGGNDSMRSVRSTFTASVLGAFIGATALNAQSVGTVKGSVRAPNGEPLAGASISATGTLHGAIARGDGTYQFTLPAGRYEVRVRVLGYAVSADSVTVSAGTTTTKDFAPQRVATTLETVAILGSRGEERSVISAPVPIDVLSV